MTDCANVAIFPYGKYDTSLHLEKAKEWKMDEVIVIGRTPDGEFCWGSNAGNLDSVAAMLAIANHRLAQMLDGDE